MGTLDRADLHHQLDTLSPAPLDVVERSLDVLCGTLVFRGTRVPAGALLDYLAACDSLDTFLDDFPSVRRDQAVALLELTDNASIMLDGLERLAIVTGGPPEISAARLC
jgi:uncharacterized protein (DUF433 family)